jgi:hypothetical protein
LSLAHITILNASSGNGRCSALASSQGARIHTSRSSSVVRILGLRAAVPIERRPGAREGKQRPILVQSKPHHILLLGLRLRLRHVLGEAVGRDKATVLRLLKVPETTASDRGNKIIDLPPLPRVN